jgi:putative ABC transport system ATP-binding protein
LRIDKQNLQYHVGISKRQSTCHLLLIATARFKGPHLSFHAPLVSLRNVNLTLPSKVGPVHILRGVDFEARPGEAIGIVGPSGSGKTSLLMVIAGLEPVTTGEISVAGLQLQGKSEEALSELRRGSVSIVFQSFHLISTLTAVENVALPLEFKGRADAQARATSCLETVGLGHRLSHYPGQLSGGEQQRVAIARAIASGAKVLLADEPTGNLDQDTGRAIMDLLFRLRDEQQATLLLVTHDPNLAKRCDRVVEVRDGKVSTHS